MDTTQEHLDIEDGNFKGLWNINPFAAKGADMWQRMDEIINAYTKLHPVEMELQVRANAVRVKTQLNDLGTTESKSIRYGASIPTGLMLKLQTIYPEVFTERNLFNQFLKRYKGLRVCQKV